MLEHFKKISDLAAKIKAAAAGGTSTTPTTKDTSKEAAALKATAISELTKRLNAAPTNFWQRFSGDSPTEKRNSAQAWIAAITKRISKEFEKLVTLKDVKATSGSISSELSLKGLARGGMAMGGNPYLVGEGGPELFLPRSSGLVLNNSVSSRLMSMLTGRPDRAGSNVTINVNNPVIRNDQDIRKLADQITRAQVSAFRTSGGRLS